MKNSCNILKLFCLLPLPFFACSCSQIPAPEPEPEPEDLFEKYNQYALTYQPDFQKRLSYTYHDYTQTCTDFYCNSEAEAVFLWAHNAGYVVWNEEWHKGNNPLEMEGEVTNVEANVPDPSNPWEWLQPQLYKNVRYKDCKYLDSALNHSTAAITLTAYHGFEPNEYDLVKFLNNTLNVNIETMPAKNFRESVNLSLLNNQSYVNLGYCATSFEKDPAMFWATMSDDYETTPLLELEIDPDVYCAYISYTNKTYFDNVFLAWPTEYQLLVNRNATITIKQAEIIVKDNGQNILYLKCHMSKQI